MLQTTAFPKPISDCLTEETKWQNRVHSYVTVSRGRATDVVVYRPTLSNAGPTPGGRNDEG
jgi:hypothetical protein